jgi:polyphosphate kinase
MEANANTNPLLERLKFLGITSSNLDEFYMIRFPSSQAEPNIRERILSETKFFHLRQYKSFLALRRLLAKENIHFLTDRKAVLEKGEAIFNTSVLPFLEASEDTQSKPLLKLANHRLGFLFANSIFYRYPLQAPSIFVSSEVKGRIEIFFADDLTQYFLERLHPKLGRAIKVRVTRDADVRVDIDVEDPEAIPDTIRKRVRARDEGRPTRIQLSEVGPAALSLVQDQLKLPADQIFHVKHSLFLHSCFEAGLQMQDTKGRLKNLYYPEPKSYIPQDLSETSKFLETLESRDFVLHHPYDSFQSLVNFIRASANDPQVKAIHQTIYRIDLLSEIVETLKSVAHTKKIFVYIEPRARFDELNNIQLAEELRKAGVQVIFPFGDLKIHAKITLVEKSNGQLYTHLSTGNYNSKTARIYTDFGILSSNQEIGRDAQIFFESIRKAVVPTSLNRLLIAPTELHKKLQSLIQQEVKAAQSGKCARIFAKVNALVDRKTIQSLYEASQAGVQVDLVVRGACSLVPKIAGTSENIRVISIVDRFLEHSRIYYFQSAGELYLSSADWMPRNFFSRLEIAFPVLDRRIFDYFTETVLPTYLQDNVKARELDSDGLWKPVSSRGKVEHRSQFKFESLAKLAYKNTALCQKRPADFIPPSQND